jgi:hypothetical protein
MVTTTLIQQITNWGFSNRISGNLADNNKYHYQQYLIIIENNQWTLFYDRLGSNIPIFKNTFWGNGSILNLNNVFNLINNFNLSITINL